MFGMTKKQFLKKSKNCLKDTGIQLLLVRKIIYQEQNGKIGYREAYQKLDKIRENMETIFFKYEGLKTPSKCSSLHIEILNTLIILQETLVGNTEYLTLSEKGLKQEALRELEKSQEQLENFRKKFQEVGQKVDVYLQ